MVSPHEIEFHLIFILSLKEAIVKALLKEGSLFIPVPVVYKHINTVLCCLFDLELHSLGVCLVSITPKRLSVPVIVCLGIVYNTITNSLPFTDIAGPEDLGSGFLTCVCGPDKRRYIIFFLHSFFPFGIINIASIV